MSINDLGRNGGPDFQIGSGQGKGREVTDAMIAETAGGARPYIPGNLTNDVRAFCAAQLPE